MVTQRPGRLPPPRRLARILAPAVFLLAVTGIVLLVRSTLRSAEPATRTVGPAVETRKPDAPAAPRPAATRRFYVIASGDTLGAIAARFSTTVDDLLQLNPGIQPTGLRPGDQIRVR